MALQHTLKGRSTTPSQSRIPSLPSCLLEEAGHAFSDPPSCDDYAALLEHSAALYLRSTAADVIYDRSPADYLAYVAAAFPDAIHPDLVATTADALATVDLVVLVPIEQPDRVGGVDRPRLRRRVDKLLREMLIDQAWPFSPSTIEVAGSPTERAELVLTTLGQLTGRCTDLRALRLDRAQS